MKRFLKVKLALITLNLTINAEEVITVPMSDSIYFPIDITNNSLYGTTGIKPYTLEKVKVFSQNSNLYVDKSKFIDTIKIRTYYNNYESSISLIPEEEAIRLKEGVNSSLDIIGSYSPVESLFFQYQIRGTSNKDTNKIEIFRALTGFSIEDLIFILGKDNIKIGPSRYGNLFSATNPPFYQVRLQSGRPFEFFGLLDFMIMYAYLKEDRKDHSNPNLVFARIDYKPNKYLEIGINRAVLFGGKGRPSYKIYEYPKLFYGSEETTGGRFDNDSYLGYDLKINIFSDKFDIFQLYYENNATDIESPLKKGDPKKLHFPLIIFKFHDNAETVGLKLKKSSFYLNWELTKTGKTMYINHNYPFEGLSYKGFVLGYPYGRSIFHTFVILGKLGDKSDNFVELGYLKQPYDIPYNHRLKDYYITVKSDIKYNKHICIQPLLRFDRLTNPNKSNLTNQFNIIKEDKSSWFGGLSLTYRF